MMPLSELAECACCAEGIGLVDGKYEPGCGFPALDQLGSGIRVWGR